MPWTAIAGAALGAIADSRAKKSAQEAQDAYDARNKSLVESMYEQARGDMLGMFPMAQAYGDQGNAAALQALQGIYPQQSQALANSTLMARDYINQGADNYANAIMGNPMNAAPVQDRAMPTGMPLADFHLPNRDSIEQQLMQQSSMGGYSSTNEAMRVDPASLQLLQGIDFKDAGYEFTPEQRQSLYEGFGVGEGYLDRLGDLNNTPLSVGDLDRHQIEGLQLLEQYNAIQGTDIQANPLYNVSNNQMYDAMSFLPVTDDQLATQWAQREGTSAQPYQGEYTPEGWAIQSDGTAITDKGKTAYPRLNNRGQTEWYV